MRQREFLRPAIWSGWAMCVCCAVSLAAAEHHGVVTFGGQPLPGAGVTLTQAGRPQETVTDMEGRYGFAGLADAPFTVMVEMQLFVPQRRDFPSGAATADWNLELLPKVFSHGNTLRAAGQAAFERTTVTSVPEPAAEKTSLQEPAATSEFASQAADGFLIDGSVHNAASSPFSQRAAFGNNRRSQPSLYNGNLGLILNNALFDARAYSLTGQNTPQPDYSRLQGAFSFGGPLRIPGVPMRNSPQFSISYQRTRNRDAATQTGRMPTPEERTGTFLTPIRDPANGLLFPANQLPAGRLSPQALSLLRLYPMPNLSGVTSYNYQLPVVSGLHQDEFESRVSKYFGRGTFSGRFSGQSVRSDTPDLFGFLDTGRVRGWDTTAGYRHTLSVRAFLNLSLNFNRLTTHTKPYFSNRTNISGQAGIEGNNQEPVNWGPPDLDFSSGIFPLSMAQASLFRNQTVSPSADLFLIRGRHNLSTGFTHRRQQFNLLSQQDARGTFGFTGAAAGNGLAGFLLGVPDTSAIAFGNADKYLRGRVYEAFFSDDWHFGPGLTINLGLRWEYWTPVSEKYGRLVNLAVGPGFQSAVPEVTLPRPDRNNLAPRAAFAWRPRPASSMVVRGGYGVYYDTSVYQPLAVAMAQQAPLSKTLRAFNSPAAPLTLADAFRSAGVNSTTAYGIDPKFQVGCLQIWRLAVQTDLPGALQMNASYTGSRGTHGQQEVLPNTFPGGALAPSGFVYLTSKGTFDRHAGDFQLRRRMRSGLTGQFQYTWSKALGNATFGGQERPLIAQNWLDLGGERGRSSFDQRHLIGTGFQYTSGMGLRGGALATGRLASLLKDWTLASQLTWGTGLPLNPVYPLAVPGTGFTGVLRPDRTGAPLYEAPPGLHLNPAAFAAPAAGTWGNAGRNSITGPRQLGINSSLGRTLRTWDRVSLDMRIDVVNVTNTPVFPDWNSVLGDARFGLPDASNPMRTAKITLRMGF